MVVKVSVLWLPSIPLLVSTVTAAGVPLDTVTVTVAAGAAASATVKVAVPPSSKSTSVAERVSAVVVLDTWKTGESP